MTHTIEIKVSAEYQHSNHKEESLVAAGFSIDFAKHLAIKE